MIPWWNTVTNKYQQAILPKQTITVAANNDFVQANNNIASTSKGDINNCPISSDVNNTPPTKFDLVRSSGWLQWLFLALWLLTSLTWFISTRIKNNKTGNGSSSVSNTKRTPPKNQQNIYNVLINDCKNDEGKQVIESIVPWVNSLSDSDHTVVTIEDALNYINNDDFTQAINQLQQCYYSGSDNKWQGKQLLAIIKKLQRQFTKNAATKKEKIETNKVNLNP